MAKRSRFERLQDQFNTAHRARQKAHTAGNTGAHAKAAAGERNALAKQHALAKDATQAEKLVDAGPAWAER